MKAGSRFLISTALATVMAGTAAGAQAEQVLTLDEITVLATKLRERAIDAMAGVSGFQSEQIDEARPARISEMLSGMPGVWVRESNANPATAISIRGLMDFGRVAVIVDGARQNFQTSGHNANGVFYADPTMISSADVVRGPVANIYGSGAIGGVASFRTKEASDILRDGEILAGQFSGTYGSAGSYGNGSFFAAARPIEQFDFIVGGSATNSGDYKDGNGNTVAGTAKSVLSSLAKLSLRPFEGHELKLGYTRYATDYPDTTYTVKNGVTNENFTGSYTLASPDNPLIDLSASAYLSKTEMDQRNATRARDFDIRTTGFDINNTSRFDAFGLSHSVTYGGDYFHDEVKTADTSGYGNLYTPGGERKVGGAFLQWKTEYNNWLEVIAAGRFDSYSLTDGTVSTSGQRLSPKITVGVKPLDGLTLYGTYAEGYRTPSVTETLVSGAHPPAMPLITCPDGSTGIFCFLPNPNLRPEIGKSLEAGLNFERAGIFTENDRLQVKANAFLNNVDDFIELVELGPPTMPGTVDYSYTQYQNIARARVHGVELEGSYDAGRWFAAASAHFLDGENADTSDGLNAVPPTQFTATLGARFFDERLTTAVRVQHVEAKGTYDSYSTVGLNLAWKPTEDVIASLSVDNLFNAQYVPYLGDPTKPSPGLAVKAGVTVRLGVK